MTATGCPDYKADSSNAWVRYSSDRQTAEVGCRGPTSTDTWQLVCRAGDWTGYVDSCSPLGIFIYLLIVTRQVPGHKNRSRNARRRKHAIDTTTCGIGVARFFHWGPTPIRLFYLSCGKCIWSLLDNTDSHHIH